ncbi:MAG: alpha-1,4-glucan--maltose-1-phosphate maltosyltransferase [Burkholderiaceae bacterium]
MRAVVDAVLPSVDDGRFAAKAVVGQPFEVTAHVFADGHDQLRVRLCWGTEDATVLDEVEMLLLGNDEWTASFTPTVPGRCRYTVIAWVDHFRSWRAELRRRVDPQDVVLAGLAGVQLVREAVARAQGGDRQWLVAWADALHDAATRAQAAGTSDIEPLRALALDDDAADLVGRYPDRSQAVRFVPGHGDALRLVVDRQRAGFSAWYELFPRSAAFEEGRHGTFRDVEARLAYVAELGFNVLYLPPIHPIGRSRRKGRNNALVASADDVGSPWAIGAAEGGHKDVLPALGTPEDFRSLVAAAKGHGMEVALDIAFQCAPDHPYVQQHPDWFRHRADGSVQYAENPPKKYEDIYPFNFETEDWRALWLELKSVFDHWIAQGVLIFRVDNPHTKSFAFWEWAISAIKREHPDVLFLAEAFTRPKVMHRLAKLGFSQSYTYFTWRNTGATVRAYFTELSQGPGRAYFRPNAWPNTPDILHEQLHDAPPAVFMTRLLLAATLSSNYGIYGPAYELMERTPRSPGSEEYLDSEKYQIRHWELGQRDSLRAFIARVNQIRRDNPALHDIFDLRFFDTGNEQLLAYAKRDDARANTIVTVVNLDPVFRQSGWVQVDAEWLGVADPTLPFQVEDLLGGQTFHWNNGTNFVILDPARAPAHVLRVQRSAAP